MISQSLYHALCNCVDYAIEAGVVTTVAGEYHRFKHPYVLVIHSPSRCGFYLDRNYRHIIDVSGCREPENPVEVERHHLCASSNLPEWVISECRPFNEFDTFWLY